MSGDVTKREQSARCDTPTYLREVRGMILAAGLGTRLRPLTLTTPKPLLIVAGKPLLAYALEHLARAGVHEVMINTHHLAAQIAQYVAEHPFPEMHAQCVEETEILGTGGALKNVEQFLHDGIFVVQNADALHAIDLAAAIATHRAHPERAATLVVRRLAGGENFTPLDIDELSLQLRAIGHGAWHFTGVTIACGRLLDALPPAGTSACLIRDGLAPLLHNGAPIGVFPYDGYFNDVGTLERLTQANRDFAITHSTS